MFKESKLPKGKSNRVIKIRIITLINHMGPSNGRQRKVSIRGEKDSHYQKQKLKVFVNFFHMMADKENGDSQYLPIRGRHLSLSYSQSEISI